MECPIRFVRKPDEAECIQEKCAFWVDAAFFAKGIEEPEKFSALGLPSTARVASTTAEKAEGKCAIRTIAEIVARGRT
ncbi:MAG: hypothetical protein AB1393_12455 [Candidatus Edwardsbacteria bacterium]